MKLLLAEDDAKLLSHLAAGLRGAGHVVDCAQDGSEARWAVENGSYEALVLDVMMPQVDGVTLVRGLRRRGITAPVIFVTARGEVRDRVAGLDAGADDYLVKPFSLEELLARLRALTRRNRGEVNQVIRVADLELDLLARSVRRGAEDIELTNREFALLELLAQSSPRTVSKSAIVERVWDQHFDGGTNVVNVYINYLRSKIDPPGQPSLIRTVRGIGFALAPREAT
ncbi:MAG TPA: response regulator transcription factor [Verrucomicrobiae bacterium]|jgi:DNA-binding response OmpR family regulator|nr:response regulator transcription factor [Verrucomicrobiae bacterium]